MYTFVVTLSLPRFSRSEVFVQRPTIEELLVRFPSEYHAELRDIEFVSSLRRHERCWKRTIDNCTFIVMRDATVIS